MKLVWDFTGYGYVVVVDVKLEEREKENNTKGLDCGSTCFDLGSWERQKSELLKVWSQVSLS